MSVYSLDRWTDPAEADRRHLRTVLKRLSTSPNFSLPLTDLLHHPGFFHTKRHRDRGKMPTRDMFSIGI